MGWATFQHQIHMLVWFKTVNNRFWTATETYFSKVGSSVLDYNDLFDTHRQQYPQWFTRNMAWFFIFIELGFLDENFMSNSHAKENKFNHKHEFERPTSEMSVFCLGHNMRKPV